jgi:hypothetical protein
MTSKEEAELLFKQEPLSGNRNSIPEYEQRARTQRTMTARLRVLRLAREAELAPKSEETAGETEKLTRRNSSRALRRHALPLVATRPLPRKRGRGNAAANGTKSL